jgi:hypothetical protein
MAVTYKLDTETKLPKITSKQIEIINLLHKYRFLTRIHIQNFLSHKDKKTIQLWLNDLRAKDYINWIYDGKDTIDNDGNAVIINSDWKVNQSTPVYLDLYYKEGYDLYQPLAQQIFVRNTGSTIGNISYVLSNIAAGLGAVSMRAEEIGAVYSLIKGSKGTVVNHKGRDLGEYIFDPNNTYPVVAGNKTIVEFCISKIKS